MRKLAIIALLLAFAAAAAVRLALAAPADVALPRAEGGVLDLRAWTFASGPVPLAGEWLFEPERFADARSAPDASQPPAGDAVVVESPGRWDEALSPGGRTPYGYGTYRLKVLLPADADRLYGLRVTNIRSAHRLFVSGEPVGAQGVPGATREDTTPANAPYTVRAAAAGDAVDIVLHVSNWHYGHQGGMFGDISFGWLEDIYRLHERTTVSDKAFALFFGGCGVMLLLFQCLRRSNGEVGYFGVIFLLLALYWTTHGNKILFDALPAIDYVWQTKLQMLATLALAMAFVLFVRSLYPAHVPRAAFVAGAAGQALQAAGVLAGDVALWTRAEAPLTAYNFLLVACMLYAMIRGTLTKPDEPVYAVAGVLSALFNALFQLLHFAGVFPGDDWPPIDVGLFVVFMGLLIVHRLLASLRRVEELSGQLLIADRLKNEFLTHTSHELRTPINGILNVAQLMLDERQGGRLPEERLSLLVASARRMTHLLDEILDLGKLNEGTVELTLRAVDARATAEAARELMLHQSERKAVPLVNAIEPGMPLVRADAQRLLQVMLNLAHDALNRPGTTGIAMRARPDGDRLWIAVVRTGARGAADAEERLETVVSRKLVELHGGELLTEAADGGAAVRFSLPTAPDAAWKAPAAPLLRAAEQVRLRNAAAGRRAGGADPLRALRSGAPRVLLADSDPDALRVMFDLLAREELSVVAVASGGQALAELERHAGWDLVVAEALLPVYSGYDLCRRLRKRFTFSDLPVLLLTRRSGPSDLLVGLEAGANDYVSKPLDLTEFTARVRTLLRMKQSVREQMRMEMALIQAQIKPHFLYNTLNTIAGLSETDPDGMRELLAEFGHYLHASFDVRNLERLVPFESEWALVESYLHIDQARFGSRIRFTADIEDGLIFMLPPLTIQPLVENALRHGILKRMEGGRIEVSVRREGGGVRVVVADDGVGFPPGRAQAVLAGEYKPGIGLTNVHRRLAAYYGEGLAIGAGRPNGAYTGATVQFLIPEREEQSS